jgi:hypothetical protein
MASDLSPGDTVDVSVTHEIVIGREKSWIKFGVSTKVQPSELAGDAIDRASELVTQQVLFIIEDAVKAVRDYESGKGIV